jgi:hypothetical protein
MCGSLVTTVTTFFGKWTGTEENIAKSAARKAAKAGRSIMSPADLERLHQSSKAMQILRRQLRKGPRRDMASDDAEARCY